MIWGGKKDVIGLDIGSSSIKMVELKEGKGGFRLQSLGMTPLPPEAIVDGALMDSVTVVEAIKEVVDTGKVKTKNTVISVSGHSVIVKKITLPLMTEAELEESIQWEAERYIPFDINDVNLDFQILGYGSENAEQMDVILVAAKKDIVHDYVSVVMEAGLNPVIVDVDAFALENMLEVNYERSEEESMVVIANIGASVTNISILRKNVTAFTRDVFKGGNQITEDIQRQFHVDHEEAEKIKAGLKVDGVPEEVLERLLRAGSEALAAEIGSSIDYFQSTSGSEKVAKIYLSGGGAKLKYLDTLLQDQIDLPVELINPFKKIQYSEKQFDVGYLREVGPMMAVAVGLATRKVGDR
jgi:type IV pilus assembly protein PilM